MRRPRSPRGFSLLEVLVATAILALVFSYVSGAFIQGGMLMSKQPRMTQAALALSGVVLDLEEEFRKEGFSENDTTNRRCELPDALEDEGFECEYDTEKLDLDAGQLGEMSQGVLEQLLGGVGDQGNILQAIGALSFLFVPLPIPIAGALCPATPNEFLNMCFQNGPAALQFISNNVIGMVGFFPMVITMASDETRKLRVRILHKDWGEDPIIQIETFVISVPEGVDSLSKENPLQPANPLPNQVPPP